jgi:hypothetical protein
MTAVVEAGNLYPGDLIYSPELDLFGTVKRALWVESDHRADLCQVVTDTFVLDVTLSTPIILERKHT